MKHISSAVIIEIFFLEVTKFFEYIDMVSQHENEIHMHPVYAYYLMYKYRNNFIQS